MVGYRQYEMFPGHTTFFRSVPPVPFWAVCCTRCGHMTKYANQEFIAQALEVTAQEQQELAKKAAREQKRQEKKGLF